MWKNRFVYIYKYIYFNLSLGGFEVPTQSNPVQIIQPWSKTLFMGRNDAHFSVLSESEFSTEEN